MIKERFIYLNFVLVQKFDFIDLTGNLNVLTNKQAASLFSKSARLQMELDKQSVCSRKQVYSKRTNGKSQLMIFSFHVVPFFLSFYSK